MLKTRVTEMLGIQYPIIKGPMAYVSGLISVLSIIAIAYQPAVPSEPTD